jgi:hypothetical protein
VPTPPGPRRTTGPGAPTRRPCRASNTSSRPRSTRAGGGTRQALRADSSTPSRAGECAGPEAVAPVPLRRRQPRRGTGHGCRPCRWPCAGQRRLQTSTSDTVVIGTSPPRLDSPGTERGEVLAGGRRPHQDRDRRPHRGRPDRGGTHRRQGRGRVRPVCSRRVSTVNSRSTFDTDNTLTQRPSVVTRRQKVSDAALRLTWMV